MDELGIIINKKGEYMTFGKWKLRELRDINNNEDWHTSSFMDTVHDTKWFKDLGIPYDENLEFQNQLYMFARYGILVIANGREDSNKPGEFRIVISAPSNLTEEQLTFLNNKRSDFIKFEDNHFSYIEIVDAVEEFKIIESFYHITEYYDYLDSLTKENTR